MSYIWTPLFLIFAYIEYGKLNFCGSTTLTGQMWFMWFMMATASSKDYISLVKRKLNANY